MTWSPGCLLRTSIMNKKEKLLSLYDILPFHEHPLWQAILKGDLSLEQILDAEIQHFLRTNAGQSLRKEAVEKARASSAELFEALIETYLEECSSQKGGVSHLDLIRRLLVTNGVSDAELLAATPTAGNAASIALYKDISSRGAACHILGAGAVEHFYSKLSPHVYQAYCEIYNMTDDQAETYRIHGPMDKVHADRAFSILDLAIDTHGWDVIEQSVRDAFVATSLHYDGMFQAATGILQYWDGRSC